MKKELNIEEMKEASGGTLLVGIVWLIVYFSSSDVREAVDGTTGSSADDDDDS